MTKTWLPIVLFVVGCGVFDPGKSQRSIASELSEQKRYDEAIQTYHEHIAKRLAVEERPDWENPYIYLLDIGDIYLEQGKVPEAISWYEEAEKRSVKQGYVNDRYRFVASWYEERGELEKAIEHLKKYRERDRLLFDMMLDRLAKALVKREDGTEPSN